MVIEFELVVLVLLFIFSLYESVKHQTYGLVVFLLQLFLLVDIADTKVR
jgi:hypothetical protein